MRDGLHPHQLQELTQALTDELRAIEDLRTALLRQRAAVAADDHQAVEQSVSAMSRVILTMDEARRRRRAVTALVTGIEGAALSDLDQLFNPMPEPLAAARRSARAAAAAVVQDIAINHQILQRTVASGHEFLQQLFSTGEQGHPVYMADAGTESTPRSVLVNRTV